MGDDRARTDRPVASEIVATASIEYVIERIITLDARADEVARWLGDIDRLKQWLVRVDRIDILTSGAPDGTGCVFRLAFVAGARAGGSGTFDGENVRVAPDAVDRAYQVPASLDPSRAYQRSVSYRINGTGTGTGTGTTVHCRIVTAIAGMNPRVANMARRADEASVDRALRRLAELVDNGKVGLVTRWRTSGGPGTPL